MNHDYDVVIAGGGLVGISLALALARSGDGRLRILVVERRAAPGAGDSPYQPGFDARSTALSRSSELVFERLGLWPELRARAAPIVEVQVTQRDRWGQTHLNASDMGWPSLGHVIENAWLGRILLQALAAAPGIELAAPATLTCSGWSPRAAHLSVRPEGRPVQELTTALLCVADGADSGLRRELGIDSRRHDYDRAALIANVCADRPHRGRALERFTPHGPLALLPLPEQAPGESLQALVWTLPPDRARALCTHPEAEFLAALQAELGWRHGRLLRAGRRECFPLSLVRSREQVRTRLAVVGNAAHSLHPVAGQGFNLALRDVAQLADLAGTAAQQDTDLGALSLLRNYAAARLPDQDRTIALSHSLPQLFEWPGWLPTCGRSLGLSALDLLPPLRRRFTRIAAGGDQPLPRLETPP